MLRTPAFGPVLLETIPFLGITAGLSPGPLTASVSCGNQTRHTILSPQVSKSNLKKKPNIFLGDAKYTHAQQQTELTARVPHFINTVWIISP